MIANIINLTEHPISWDPAMNLQEIEPSGKICRVFFEQELDHHINGYPAYKSTTGWIKGLPKPKDGTVYIVSGIVFQNTLRPDVYTPNTQPWSVSHRQHGAVKCIRSLLCHPKVIA